MRAGQTQDFRRALRSGVHVEVQTTAQTSAKCSVQRGLGADDGVIPIVSDGHGIFRLPEVAVEDRDGQG
jgi:hypothetical protein